MNKSDSSSFFSSVSSCFFHIIILVIHLVVLFWEYVKPQNKHRITSSLDWQDENVVVWLCCAGGLLHSHVSLCGARYLPHQGFDSSWCHPWYHVPVHPQGKDVFIRPLWCYMSTNKKSSVHILLAYVSISAKQNIQPNVFCTYWPVCLHDFRWKNWPIRTHG